MQYISGQHIFNTTYLRSWSQVLGSTSPRIAEREFSILLHGTILFYAFKYPGVDGSDVQLENFPYYRGEAGISPATASRAIPSTHSPILSQCAGKFSQPGKQSYYLSMDLWMVFTSGQTLPSRTDTLMGWLSRHLWSPCHQTRLSKVCVKSRVTLKSQTVIIRRDSPQHFPSYPK